MKNEIEKYFDLLWPITRSLTGNGNRKTLKILSEIVDMEIHEVPSGTACLDWTVPPEWNINEAWIKDENGIKIVDFAINNLHILGYSIPIHTTLSLNDLKEHLYTLTDYPDVIPYLTSYYKERWGFCISHNQLLNLKEGNYEVNINSVLDYNGSLTYGEAVLQGELDKEILISTYICHPSLANNELSGPLVSAFIYRELEKIKDRKFTYRFLFLPETIGAIVYLSKFGQRLKEKLVAGYVITCVGDRGDFTYKRSRTGNSISDRAAELILKQTEITYLIKDFFPGGSDERQYCSPGFNLPVGSLMRTMYGFYKEYHTSADNKDFISFEALQNSVFKYLEIFKLIELNGHYLNKFPYGEPQLGKRGLYPSLGSQKKKELFIDALMWFLNYSDGKHDLIEIIDKSGIDYHEFYSVISRCVESGLIDKI